MVYPHVSKTGESKHIQLIEHAKSHDIRLECFLYLGAMLVQSHEPSNKSQESINRLAKEALADLMLLAKKSGKEFRFFKLSCDGMYREDMFGLFICIAPVPLGHKGHRLTILCQDIMKQNKSNNSRFKTSSRKRKSDR